MISPAIMWMLLFVAAPAAPTSGIPVDPVPESAEPSGESIGIPVAALCERAERLLEDGSKESLLSARRLFTAAATHHPEATCGHAGTSRAILALYLRQIEPDDALIERALEEARTATRLDPRSATARAALSSALQADLSPDEASSEADAALALDPDSIPALLAAASIWMSQGRMPEARALLDHAVSLRPDLPAARFLLGNLLLLQHEPAAAINAYTGALLLSPDFVPAATQRAVAYAEMGNLHTSAAIFERLLAQHPEDAPRIHLYMAQSLMKRESWNAALAILERADFKTRRGVSKGTAIFLQAICYEHLARTADAIAAYRRLISEWPEATGGLANPERLALRAYESLGRMHLAAGDAEKAAAVLEEGASQPDAGPALILRLGRLYDDYGLPAKAARLLERGAAGPLTPRTADTLMALYVSWARAARRSGDAAALGGMIESLEGRTDGLQTLNDVVHHLEAARAFSIAGRGDKALEAFRGALALGYSQTGWIGQDPDFEALRAAPGYLELSRPTD